MTNTTTPVSTLPEGAIPASQFHTDPLRTLRSIGWGTTLTTSHLDAIQEAVEEIETLRAEAYEAYRREQDAAELTPPTTGLPGRTGNTIYLAGPMRGYEYFNFFQFLTVGDDLAQAGWNVINPATHDMENGFNPIMRGYDGNEDLEEIGFSLDGAMRWDLEQIVTKADAVAVLPGWGRSEGARTEVRVAEAIGLPIFDAGDLL